MHRFFVTGGAGFIGSAFVRQLLDRERRNGGYREFYAEQYGNKFVTT